MNMSIHRWMLNAGAAAGLLLAAGCVGTESGGGRSGNSAPKVLEVSDKPLKPKTPARNLELLADRSDLLRIGVVAGADDPDSAGDDIAMRVRGALADRGTKVVVGNKFDVGITISPRFIVFDRDGDYYRMNCEVDVVMRSADGKRVYGAKKIELASRRRVLGKQSAISKLGAEAAAAAAKWCSGQLKRIADVELGAVMLSIQLPPAPKSGRRNGQNDARDIKWIGDKLAEMPNLLAYEFADMDHQTGVCRYRVVYFISAYPHGIANEVAAFLKADRK